MESANNKLKTKNKQGIAVKKTGGYIMVAATIEKVFEPTKTTEFKPITLTKDDKMIVEILNANWRFTGHAAQNMGMYAYVEADFSPNVANEVFEKLKYELCAKGHLMRGEPTLSIIYSVDPETGVKQSARIQMFASDLRNAFSEHGFTEEMIASKHAAKLREEKPTAIIR